MKQGRFAFLILVAAFLLLLRVDLGLAQEETTTEPAVAVSEPEVLWLWGEIVSVDAKNKELVVKFFDYETDIEKEIVLKANDQTTYENVSSMEEIIPQETVSIDYVVDAEGNNVARNVSVEKIEGSQEAPQEEIKPEEIIQE